MEWRCDEPPKDRKILGFINFCGQKRINVILWMEHKNCWVTDMQLNHINPPICWMHLPEFPDKK
jgi:hypothetical protein